MRDARGLTVYEVNLVTKEVKEADYKPGSIFISASFDSSETTETFILQQHENCQYFMALNMINAIRKSGKYILTQRQSVS